MLPGYSPSDYFPREEVDDDTKVIPLITDSDVSGIAGPDAVRLIWIKFLFKVILAFSVGTRIAELRLTGRHCWKIHGFHQAVHSAGADLYTIITGKNSCDFIRTNALLVIGVNLENGSSDFLIFQGPCRRCGMKMFVVGTTVYFKNTAKRLNVMLAAKPVNGF